MGDKRRSRKGKSKPRKDGKRRKSRKRSSEPGVRFRRYDEQAYPCAGFAGSRSPLSGNECYWGMSVPGVPRAFRSLVPPIRAPGSFQLALDAANSPQTYQLRNMGVRGRDARRIAELRAMQGGDYANYVLGNSLRKGSGRMLPLLAMSGGQIDPMMAMAMSGRGGFDPLMYSMAQGGKFDPMMYAMMRGRK